MSSEFSNDTFKFDSPAGWALCRQILHDCLPFGPHNYQLEGVTAILDGKDFIGVSATGSGKSGYIYMTLHIILAILANPQLCPTVKFPANPTILMIYPTKALEEDQEQKFRKLGLTAKAINGDTVDEARRIGIDLWKLVESAISLILVSPEMLNSPGFQTLMKSEVFQSRLFAIGSDEVHLLCSWGLEFRQAFKSIAYVRKRFRDKVALFGMTATLRKGQHKDAVCDFLGLRNSNLKFICCTNACPDVRLVFRTWHATDASNKFLDVDWLVNEPGKTLIFCTTIHLGFKILVYLWNLKTKRPEQKMAIQMYNLLNSAEHNCKIFQLLERESGSDYAQITIATDKLSVGVDIPDFRTVVILNPPTLNDLWQKAGRVGHDRAKVKDGQVFIYFPKSVLDAAAGQPSKSKSRGKKTALTSTHGNKNVTPVDGSLHAVITALCKTSEINNQYENFSAYPPCSRACTTCTLVPATPTTACKCSGCLPDTIMSSLPTTAKAPRRKTLPISIRITEEMRQLALKRLKQFRKSCWANADDLTTGMTPIESYMPDTIMDSLINLLPTLYTPTLLRSIASSNDSTSTINDDQAARMAMSPFTAQNKYVADQSSELVLLLLDLHLQFDNIRAHKRSEARAKREESKQQKNTSDKSREHNLHSSSDDSEADDSESGMDEDSGGEDNEPVVVRSGILLRIDPRKVSLPGYRSITFENNN